MELPEIVSTVFVPMIAYFLYNIHQDIKAMSEKVDKLAKEQAATDVRIQEHERRLSAIEFKKST